MHPEVKLSIDLEQMQLKPWTGRNTYMVILLNCWRLSYNWRPPPLRRSVFPFRWCSQSFYVAIVPASSCSLAHEMEAAAWNSISVITSILLLPFELSIKPLYTQLTILILTTSMVSISWLDPMDRIEDIRQQIILYIWYRTSDYIWVRIISRLRYFQVKQKQVLGRI